MIEVNREGLCDGELVGHVCGDLAELADYVIGLTESELPGFGQPGRIASTFDEMDFELLPLRSAEGKVLK